MSLIDEVTAANESYASGFAKAGLPMPPGRRFAVVTCMDARLDPAKFLGLEEGDAHVIRNAGGLVNDETRPARPGIALDRFPALSRRGAASARERRDDPSLTPAAGLLRRNRLRLFRRERSARGNRVGVVNR